MEIHIPNVNIDGRLTQDWDKIRESLIITAEQKMMSHPVPFDTVCECKKCGTKQVFQYVRPLAVEIMVDFIIEQMEEYLKGLRRYKNSEEFKALIKKYWG